MVTCSDTKTKAAVTDSIPEAAITDTIPSACIKLLESDTTIQVYIRDSTGLIIKDDTGLFIKALAT